MPYTLFLDICVAVLLIVTICYAIALNKRLARLRNDKKDLEHLARNFGESTQRAEDNINKLRTIAQALDIQMERAQSLRDDLAFLTERGTSAADKLEDMVREARDGLGAVPKPGRASPPASTEKRDVGKPLHAGREDEHEARSDAERELLRALRDAG